MESVLKLVVCKESVMHRNACGSVEAEEKMYAVEAAPDRQKCDKAIHPLLLLLCSMHFLFKKP